VNSPARVKVLRTTQYNGYFGCSFCYAKGIHKCKKHVYPLSHSFGRLRTDEQIRKDMKIAFKTKTNVRGIKEKMSVKKFVLILRSKSSREEIMRAQKIFLELRTASSVQYRKLTELEYIDEDENYVLFNELKKPIKVKILANEDSENALLPLCNKPKRPTIRKHFSNSPVSTKESKKRANEETGEEGCTQEKKRLSHTKEKVIEASDALYTSDAESDKETEPSPISETGQNSIVKIRRSSTPEARRSRTPEARRSPTPEGRRSSTPEATPRHVEVNVVINPINKKFQNGEPKKPFSQRKYENDVDLSSIQPKPSSHEQMNPPIFTPEGSKNNKNKSSEKVTTVNKNMFVEPLEDEIVNMSYNDEPVFEKVQESTSKFDSRKNDTDKENAKTTRNSKKDLNNDSISPEKTMVNKFKTVDQKRKTVVVAGYTMDENYYNKARSSKNVASRLSSIMSGFWSDEEASKYCLKARSDKPHLQEIGDAELMPIKNIFDAINEAIPLKIMNKKKNNGVKLDDEIRNCASSNFKARRKKLKSVIPTPASTPQSTNLSVEFKDISQIDNEIARLEKLKDDLNKNKKENENVSLQQLRAMEESLKMRELELNRKEKFIKQREEELNNPERE
ncbi:hypothetical protein KQX54_010651, partial [Cotesia glomerata]